MALGAPAVAAISSSTTGKPALARCAAMREPMVPAPRTAALRMRIDALAGGVVPASAGCETVSAIILALLLRNSTSAVMPRRVPRDQTLRQRPRKLCSDLFCRKGALRLVPLADPVQRAGNRKRGDLGIARRNGPVGDAFLDERAEPPVDLPFRCAYFHQGIGRQIAFVQPHDASSEIDSHDVRIRVDKCL